MDGGLIAGPVGLNWGWFVAGGLILTVGISLGELASSIPTAGAVYVACFQWGASQVEKEYQLQCWVFGHAIALCVCVFDCVWFGGADFVCSGGD